MKKRTVTIKRDGAKYSAEEEKDTAILKLVRDLRQTADALNRHDDKIYQIKIRY